jgi:hypothetical protein
MPPQLEPTTNAEEEEDQNKKKSKQPTTVYVVAVVGSDAPGCASDAFAPAMQQLRGAKLVV